MNEFNLCRAILLLAAALGMQSAVHAQGYPAKAVRIVVPFVAGTGGDFAARLYAPRLTEALGQQFIIDNRGGASGNIGAEIAARAAPDGYTLLTISATHAIGQSLHKNPTYDLVRDFSPLALFASTPYVLAVHPSVPARNIRELLALAKARPGQLTCGSGPTGSGGHLALQLLMMQGHVEILHVPYKGTAPAIADLIGGQISMTLATQVMPQVKAGRLRALAITSARRSLTAPDVPTVSESGLPGYEAGTWFGLLAPAGTSRDIVRRLNAEVTRIAQTPEIRDQLMAQSSAEPMSGTPEEVGAYIRSEILKWRKVVVASGMHPE